MTSPSMLRRSSALALLLVLATSACDAGEPLPPEDPEGAACESDDECGEALVCVLARCRAACTGYAECEVGSACLLDAALGARGCRLGDESACEGECPAGSACVAGRCRAECASSDTCGGTACVASVCEEPDETRALCDDGFLCGSGVCDEFGCDRELAMALGGSASCVLRDSGSVDCAGSDAAGLLGDGEPADGVRAELAPIDVTEPAQWLGVGASHACAVLYGGEVWCWGAADRGQTAAAGATATPALALAAPEDESATIDELVLGAHHACARRASGVIECWGSDAAGQLGDATVHPACTAGGPCSATAVVVEALSDTFDLAAGRDATCAVRESGAVACWGRADTGLLGASPADAAACTLDDGTTATCRGTPLDVPDVERAITIAVGDQHACAVDEDGVVWCWGGSAAGQAGAVAATVGVTEVELPVASVAVVAGRAHTCALAIDETVWCWGANDLVQRGQGDEPGDATPTRVPGLPPAIDLASGADHLCALTSDAEIWCWGRDAEGQLADGAPASAGEGPPRRITRS